MSLMTHNPERPFAWAERPVSLSPQRKGRLRRIALGALTVLSMGSVFTALIALKTAAYVWHVHV